MLSLGSEWGKYGFYDCGAFGLFASASERWQPTNHGVRSSRYADFFGSPRPKIVPSNVHAWDEISPIIAALGSGSVILDVGAYIGTFCIPVYLCAREAGLDIQVHSFEPGPTHDLLRINVDLNDLDQSITVHNQAVTSFDGYAAYTFTEGGAIGGNVFARAGERSIERIVKALTLDTAVKDLSGPLFIKLDTQGHEPRIFQGAKAIIKQKRACWRIELLKWSALVELDGETFAELLMREFHVFEQNKEIADGHEMNALLDEVDARKSRMTDVLLIPRDGPITNTILSSLRAV